MNRSLRQRLLRNTVLGVLLMLTGNSLFAQSTTAEPKEESNAKRYARWEPAIRRFEKQDRINPPPEDPILFAGASNIRRWDLKVNFPNLPTINRGFGGAMIEEVNHFADRMVLPYAAKTIVFYGGANDRARGKKSPQQILADFKTFVKIVHDKHPETKIVFMSLPHFYRHRDNLDEIIKVKELNRLIEVETKLDKRLVFVELNSHMADADGKPRADLFVKDGVHVTPKGYAIWAKQLMPHLK